MGKPYVSELGRLSETYAWAMNTSIKELAQSLRQLAPRPLVVSGSGGSLTVAHLAAWLHQRFCQQLAKSVTPLEVLATPVTRQVGALLISSGGKNSDVLRAFRFLSESDPHQLVTLCCQPDSPLVTLGMNSYPAQTFVYPPPSGKDGFLSTNTLLGLSVLLCRAYEEATSQVQRPPTLPETLPELLASMTNSPIENWQSQLAPLWERDTLLVLHGPTTQAAALDLESKFGEAALGTIQVTDYRNFAHGRHHWLAKRNNSTGVLALICQDDALVAKKTLALLPSETCIVPWEFNSGGVNAALASLVGALYIAGYAGQARGIDPGQPGVPDFGRRIYKLSVSAAPARRKKHSLNSVEEVAIRRKTGCSPDYLYHQGSLKMWQQSLHEFVQRVEHTNFGAVVLDYDGTLCGPIDRQNGWRPEIAAEVERLLRLGMIVGIATGRGVSVQRDLRKHLPEELWPKIIVAYYNGAYIEMLHQVLPAQATTPPEGALAQVAQLLKTDEYFRNLCEVESRHLQISIEVKDFTKRELVGELLRSLLQRVTPESFQIVRSDHSFDVLPMDVSKTAIISYIKARSQNSDATEVLCIGDAGRWPGNDFALLNTPYSLSSDETSPDAKTCWNLASSGLCSTEATLSYLQGIAKHHNRLQIRLAGFNKSK